MNDEALREKLIAIEYPDGLQEEDGSSIMHMIKQAQERRIDRLVHLIAEDRAATRQSLLAEIAERGPKDVPLPPDDYVAKGDEIKHYYAKAATNNTNAKWRKLLTELAE